MVKYDSGLYQCQTAKWGKWCWLCLSHLKAFWNTQMGVAATPVIQAHGVASMKISCPSLSYKAKSQLACAISGDLIQDLIQSLSFSRPKTRNLMPACIGWGAEKSLREGTSKPRPLANELFLFGSTKDQACAPPAQTRTGSSHTQTQTWPGWP